jgi:hypothetical protein
MGVSVRHLIPASRPGKVTGVCSTTPMILLRERRASMEHGFRSISKRRFQESHLLYFVLRIYPLSSAAMEYGLP